MGIGWKYTFTVENVDIDNGYGFKAELFTYGDSFEELIDNAILLYYDNNGEKPRQGPAELDYKALYGSDKQKLEEIIQGELVNFHTRSL